MNVLGKYINQPVVDKTCFKNMKNTFPQLIVFFDMIDLENPVFRNLDGKGFWAVTQLMVESGNYFNNGYLENNSKLNIFERC